MNINMILTEKEKEIINNHTYLIEKKNDYIDYKNKICLKPWGYEYLAYESNKIGIWILKMNFGHKTSLHTHFKKDTTLIVINGCIKLNLIDNYLILPIMSIINIPKYKFHSIECLSNEILVLEIEIFNENLNFSDKNDVLRIDDIYNRKSTGYESSINISFELDKYNYIYFDKDIKNSTFKIINNSSKINSNNIYILLNGIFNYNGIYIHPGSIIKNEFLLNQDVNNVTILEINKPFYKEDNKIIYNLEQLELIVKSHKNEKIILTSGCFDIIHIGHIHNLKQAKLLGDKLFVCLSNDNQIKKLKGINRPINNYNDRIELFKTIEYVDYIILYDEEDIENEITLNKIMKIVEPLYWVKGSDYNKDDITKKHPTVNIKLIDNIPDISTTTIIRNIKDNK